MRTETVYFFDDREEAAADILRQTGMPRYAADSLVYIAKVPEAVSRDIERGTGLRQSEVSLGVKYLEERGWITWRMERPDGRGHHIRFFSLAVPIETVLESITKEVRKRVKREAVLMRKLREMG